MASNKTVTLAKYGLSAALGAAASLTITTFIATTATIATANITTANIAGTATFTAESGTSTGVILCLRSTGSIGKCSGNGTGSGTRICSTCAAL